MGIIDDFASRNGLKVERLDVPQAAYLPARARIVLPRQLTPAVEAGVAAVLEAEVADRRPGPVPRQRKPS